MQARCQSSPRRSNNIEAPSMPCAFGHLRDQPCGQEALSLARSRHKCRRINCAFVTRHQFKRLGRSICCEGETPEKKTLSKVDHHECDVICLDLFRPLALLLIQSDNSEPASDATKIARNDKFCGHSRYSHVDLPLSRHSTARFLILGAEL